MINYLLIAEANKFYQSRYYEILELPWVVRDSVLNITKPENKRSIKNKILGGSLVGSAEQSFLQQVIDKGIRGCYQATTPCFRDDDIDDLHQQYFIKTELFYNIDQDPMALKIVLNKFIEDANCFFSQYVKTEVIPMAKENTFDIVCARTKIELGSYGIGYHKDCGYWVYGTGVAEPRLSYVINLNSI